MHVAIIYCHPHKQSHNARILDTVVQSLQTKNISYDVLDLYAMNFNAHVSEKEYERMAITKERVTEPDVIAAQDIIKSATHLVFIYPVYWYNMPARLKGFMDRVFSPGFAYRFFKRPVYQEWAGRVFSYIPVIRYFLQPYAALPLLKGKKAYIFRTYGGPSYGRNYFGNTYASLEQNILRFCGITHITLRELFSVDKKEVFTKEKETQYLDTVRQCMMRLR